MPIMTLNGCQEITEPFHREENYAKHGGLIKSANS